MKRYRIFGVNKSQYLKPIGVEMKKTFRITLDIYKSSILFEQSVNIQILRYEDECTFILLSRTIFETAPLFAQYPQPLLFEFNAN